MDESIRWTNRSPAEIADVVNEQGFEVSDDTVRMILTKELGLRRRAAVKDEGSCKFPERSAQFEHIAARRAWYEERGLPVISIDTKKKEILGDFYRPGQAYTDGLLHVADHDFVASGQRLVPYGVYDTIWNEGFFLLTRGSDTSELACDAIARWWQRMGRWHFDHADRMLLTCDCGGSNGYRLHRFKEDLCALAARLGRDIEVAHYPPGCSKYNLIEHRLFCHATRSLACAVLRTIEVACDLLGRTKTAPGLRVMAEIAHRSYEKGRKATAEFLSNPPIIRHTFLPQLNYTALATPAM